MIMVEKKLVDSLPPTVVGHHSDSSEAQNLLPGEKSSSSDGSSNSPPHQIYKQKVDTSRVPRIFYSYDNDDDVEGEEDGFYMYPEDDIELLEWSRRPSHWYCVGAQPEVYHVEVNGDSCTVEECLKLLKEIACESRFIACSVEDARLFFAELNKDEAAKLKGVNGICSVYPRGDLLFDI